MPGSTVLSVPQDIEKLLNENRIFRMRTVDIGTVQCRGRDRLGLFGPDDPRLRPAWDLTQVAALRRLRAMDFDHSRSAKLATASRAIWSAIEENVPERPHHGAVL